MLSDDELARWTEWAKRDDWHQLFVGSDIRQMLGEIVRLRSRDDAPAPTPAREGVEPCWQEVSSWFGTPVGASIEDYASKVRRTMAAHPRADAVALAAREFCAELCEDSPDVPQPQLKALHIALDKWEAFAPLTPTPPTAAGEPLGRFDHHPDPAIDFCVEVEELQGMAANRKLGFNTEPTLDERVAKAMLFRVGGDEGAVKAKGLLREIEASLTPTAAQPEEGARSLYQDERAR
jgi:hypothetical protein